MRGVLTAVLALIALEAVVKSNASATRFGQLFTSTAGILQHILDPTVPAIPDLTASSN